MQRQIGLACIILLNMELWKNLAETERKGWVDPKGVPVKLCMIVRGEVDSEPSSDRLKPVGCLCAQGQWTLRLYPGRCYRITCMTLENGFDCKKINGVLQDLNRLKTFFLEKVFLLYFYFIAGDFSFDSLTGMYFSWYCHYLFLRLSRSLIFLLRVHSV